MILSAQTILQFNIVSPTVERTVHHSGLSYGIGPAGYDIRIDQDIWLNPGEFKLASSYESFKMPRDVVGTVHDKSTWARLGLAVQNTVIEPGWEGWLTLELTNHSDKNIAIEKGTPIAQVIFLKCDAPTIFPYSGKYQYQKRGIQEAIRE